MLFSSLYILPITFLVVCLVLIVVYVLSIESKRHLAVKDIETKLSSFCTNQAYSLEKIINGDYDYRLELKTSIYYIKLIKNFKNKELCIYDKSNFVMRNYKSSDKGESSLEFLKLLDINLVEENIKKNKKLFIIYPDCKIMSKYINPNEIEFIYSDTDVYGTNIITARDLLELKELN